MGGGAGRHLILRICAAVWGVAIAIAAAPLISRPAPPGQIPGPATTFGIDARAPFWFIALLVAIPLLMPWITSALLRPLLEPGTRRWARNCAAISMLVPIWFVTITQDILWVIVPAALVLIVCVAARHLRADFSLHDAILLRLIAIDRGVHAVIFGLLAAALTVIDTELFDLQSFARDAADMLIALEQARSMAMFATMMAAEENAAERRNAVSAAKVQIGRSGKFISQQAIQLHGGIGMTMEYKAGHYFKRLTMIDTMFGDADYHLRMLARDGRPVAA